MCVISVNIEDPDARRKRHQHHEAAAASRAKQGNDKTGGVKRATDDYHYDKFKKQFRR